MSDSARLLRGAGLRLTAPRLAVLDAVRELGAQPATAEQLYLRLRQGYAQPSLASIYRVLAELAAAGLVLRSRIGQARTRYAAGAGLAPLTRSAVVDDRANHPEVQA